VKTYKDEDKHIFCRRFDYFLSVSDFTQAEKFTLAIFAHFVRTLSLDLFLPKNNMLAVQNYNHLII
jgi:hypothetical protein